MKTIFKKVFSVLLILVMLCGIVNVNANANTNDNTIVASGKAGTSVNWELDSNGVFSVKGTGKMYSNLFGLEEFEWASVKDSIKKIVISEGVTDVADYAFYSCNNLTSIEIANSVKEIGYAAFASCRNLKKIEFGENSNLEKLGGFGYCESLESITVPDSVTTITDEAFIDCSSLKKIYISEKSKLKKIVDFFTFAGCSSLKEISIPAGVSGISALSDCVSLEAVNIYETSSNFKLCSVDGVVYSSRFGKLYSLVLYPAGKTDKTYMIPKSVQEISRFAFCGNPYLEKIDLESDGGLINIHSLALNGCASLKEVDFSEAGEHSEYCTVDGVIYSKDMKQLFYYPAAKTDEMFTIPASVEKLGSPDLYTGAGTEEPEIYMIHFRNVKHLKFEEGITKIDYYFAVAKNLETLEIPASVADIQMSAFVGCMSLQNFIVNDNNENYTSSEGVIYSKDKTVLLFYPCGRTDKQFSVPKYVKTIGEKAFYNCKTENIKIGDNVIKLEKDSLTSKNLKTISYDGSKVQWEAIEKEAFKYDSTIVNCRFSQPVYIADIWTGDYTDDPAGTYESNTINYWHEDFSPLCQDMAETMPEQAEELMDAIKFLQEFSLSYALNEEAGSIDIYISLIVDIIHSVCSTTEMVEVLNGNISKDINYAKNIINGLEYNGEKIEDILDTSADALDCVELQRFIAQQTFECLGIVDDYLSIMEDVIGNMGKVVTIGEAVNTVITKSAMLNSVIETRDGIKNVISKMKDNCTDEVLRYALEIILNAVSSKLTLTELRLCVGVEEYLRTGLTLAVDLMVEYLSSDFPYLAAFTSGITVGSIVSDLLYNTSGTIKALEVMLATANITGLLEEVCLQLKNEYLTNGYEEATATIYNEAERMYLAALIFDCTYGFNCFEEYFNKGFLNIIKKLISGINQKMEDAAAYIDDLIANIGEDLNYLELSWILDDEYLRKDYPEVFEFYAQLLQQQYFDTTPKLNQPLLTSDGKIKITYTCNTSLSKNQTVDGYEIFCKKGNGNYSRLIDIKSAVMKEYSWNILEYSNDEFSFKVRSYMYVDEKNRVYSEFSNEKSIVINPTRAPVLTRTFTDESTAIFVFRNDTMLDGYDIYTHIYRRAAGDTKNELIKTIKNAPFMEEVEFADTKAVKGVEYIYTATTVCVNKKTGASIESQPSEEFCIKIGSETKAEDVVLSYSDSIVSKQRAISASNSAAVLVWNNTNGYDEIVIMKKYTGADTYVDIATIAGKDNSYFDTDIASGETYKYRMAFYYNNGNKRVLCGLSDVYEITTPEKSGILWVAGNKSIVTHVTYGQQIVPPEFDLGENCKIVAWSETIPEKAGERTYRFNAILECTHEWNNGVVTKAATTKETGEKVYICNICSETKTEILPKVEDKPVPMSTITWIAGNKKVVTTVEQGKPIIAPTIDLGKNCKIVGWKEKIPEKATKTTYQFNAILDCSHEWNNGIVTKAPTLKETGIKKLTCTVCSEIKTEIIPKIEHAKKDHIDENYDGMCDMCGVVYREITEIKITNTDAVKSDNKSDNIFVLNGTAVAKLLETANVAVSVVDKNGKAVKSDKKLVTGMQLILKNKNGKIIDTKTVVVPGDVDCDGNVKSADARLALRAAVKLETLDNYQSAAADMADMSKKLSVTSADARYILRVAVGLESIGDWLKAFN